MAKVKMTYKEAKKEVEKMLKSPPMARKVTLEERVNVLWKLDTQRFIEILSLKNKLVDIQDIAVTHMMGMVAAFAAFVLLILFALTPDGSVSEMMFGIGFLAFFVGAVAMSVVKGWKLWKVSFWKF